MNFVSSLALSSAALAVYVATLSYRLSRAPGWAEQRWFSAVAVAIGGYSLLNVPLAVGPTDAAVLAISCLQVVFIALHSAAWLMYSRAWTGAPARRWETALAVGLIVVGVAGVVPGVVYRLPVRRTGYAALNIAYAVPETTVLGDVILSSCILVLALVTARSFSAWRRRERHAFVQFASLALLFAFGANDALVAMGAYAGPYLIDLAFIIPVAAVGYSLTSRFVEGARALAELRLGLQRLVDERTRELTATQDALHSAEKLAALGQFSTGVAHEVNNPAAVVSANLRYLDESLDEGGLAADARECIRESISAVDRISAIVRQLLDAGRLAANKIPLEPVPLASCARDAAATARARIPERVAVAVEVDEALRVMGQHRILVQILTNLVVNGGQAVPEGRPGRVVLAAERHAGRIRVRVEDDGVGMSEEVRRRLFEPFFSTKPIGVGTGLGLSVSRGLTLSMGGSLRIESAVGQGTRVVLEVDEAPEAAPDEVASRPLAAQAPAGHRRTLLLLDDDPAVLRALVRLLEPHYDVLPARSVEEALALADQRRPDLILTDVMMPDGGGEALFHALSQHFPELAQRTMFLTGGATGETVRKFLAHQLQPVLEKPLDLATLARAIERLAPGGARDA